jgi:hypothetical protein
MGTVDGDSKCADRTDEKLDPDVDMPVPEWHPLHITTKAVH